MAATEPVLARVEIGPWVVECAPSDVMAVHDQLIARRAAYKTFDRSIKSDDTCELLEILGNAQGKRFTREELAPQLYDVAAETRAQIRRWFLDMERELRQSAVAAGLEPLRIVTQRWYSNRWEYWAGPLLLDMRDLWDWELSQEIAREHLAARKPSPFRLLPNGVMEFETAEAMLAAKSRLKL